MAFTVSTHDKEVKDSLKRIRRRGTTETRIALKNAVVGRRGQGSVKSDITRHIAKQEKYKQTAVKRRIRFKVKYARRPTVSLLFNKRPLNIIEKTGTRQTAKGISYMRDGKRALYKHAFIANINGSRKAMIRVTDKTRPSGLVGRLPIRALNGISVGLKASRSQLTLRSSFNKRIMQSINKRIKWIDR